MTWLFRLLLPLLIFGLFTACQPAPPPNAAPPADSPDAGLHIAGSSTVGPITLKVVEEFAAQAPDVSINVEILGTGGGFSKFCQGETDISNASRPIKDSEAATCAENGIEYIELPVAFDGLAVVTNPQNEFATCLTIDELNTVWTPSAEGQVNNWQQIRPSFPDQPLILYGAGTESGTYDYFTEAVVGEEGVSRMDFLGSEDDNILVDRLAQVPAGLGFFGLSYYDENRDRLKLIAIDGGNGCVEPNTETVARNLYQPLSRPLFIYINTQKLTDNPDLEPFIEFYLSNVSQWVAEVGYVPLTEQLYQLARQRFETRTLGSVFEGGANVGVSLPELLAREQ